MAVTAFHFLGCEIKPYKPNCTLSLFDKLHIDRSHSNPYLFFCFFLLGCWGKASFHRTLLEKDANLGWVWPANPGIQINIRIIEILSPWWSLSNYEFISCTENYCRPFMPLASLSISFPLFSLADKAEDLHFLYDTPWFHNDQQSFQPKLLPLAYHKNKGEILQNLKHSGIYYCPFPPRHTIFILNRGIWVIQKSNSSH